jgi:hypothetical protein
MYKLDAKSLTTMIKASCDHTWERAQRAQTGESTRYVVDYRSPHLMEPQIGVEVSTKIEMQNQVSIFR